MGGAEFDTCSTLATFPEETPAVAAVFDRTFTF
jgi:hypothetical protein